MRVELLSSSLSTSGTAPESLTPLVPSMALSGHTILCHSTSSSSTYKFGWIFKIKMPSYGDFQLWLTQQQPIMTVIATLEKSQGGSTINRPPRPECWTWIGNKNGPHNNFSCCYPLHERFQESLTSFWLWRLITAASKHYSWMVRFHFMCGKSQCFLRYPPLNSDGDGYPTYKVLSHPQGLSRQPPRPCHLDKLMKFGSFIMPKTYL